MRRIIDDAEYTLVKDALYRGLLAIHYNPNEVSEYSYGMNRAQVHLITQELLRRTDLPIKYGHCEHANGIGNNNAIEIIYTSDNGEEHICGLLHLTADMFSSVIAWISDIDQKRRTDNVKIRPQ